MTDQQSEALRLADLLEPCCLTIGDGQQAVAAAELRRQHDLLGKSRALNRIRGERIKELEQALGAAVVALDAVKWDGSPSFVKAALATARQTLGGAA